ncbi:MAG: hypothetical protein JHC33_14575 [Ignisphaera sp.]|nr:hypothetical protein [Ignisphaera sp.]
MEYNDPKILVWMKTAKRNDICPFLVCDVCNSPITTKTKHHIQQAMSPSKGSIRKSLRLCCSNACSNTLNSRYHSPITSSCALCGKLVIRHANQIKRSKTGLCFCSSSCAGTYSNTHKTVGNRRSKLEIWLEEQLTSLYSDLSIQFNAKDTIQSELDIYIPSLKLAFELNGIFHYEPIFSQAKLDTIQNNDKRKFQACLEYGIELCIIDSSKQQRFTEKSSKQYLDIITTIINSKLLATNV